MAALLDTFTGVDGTDITAHTATTGESWTYHSASVASPSAVIATNRLRANKAGDEIIYSSWVAASADYDVEADLFVFTVAASSLAGVHGRCDTAVKTNYFFGYQVSDLKWHIFKNVAGVFTDLGTPVSATLTVSQTYHIKLSMRGTTITGYVDGVSTISVTDSAISAIGRSGIWVQGALSNSTGIHLDNFSASDAVAAANIAVTNANLFWSPGSWFTSGSTYKQTANPGAYLKFGITGTASIALALDPTPLSGASIATADYPKIAFSINGGVITTVQPTGTSYTLQTGLTSGSTYLVEVWFIASKQTNDRWTTPANVLRITAITADTGATTTSLSGTALALRTKRALVFGDSITEGVESLGINTGDLSSNDARQTWVRYAMIGLDAEYGQIGFGFQGFIHTGNGNVPVLGTSYALYHTGQSRTLTGYDYVFVNMGTNDTAANSATLTALSVTNFLTALRSAIGGTAKIFVLIPFSQINLATLSTAITTAQGSDALIYKIDLGTPASLGLTLQGSASWASADNLHPNLEAGARLGSMVAKATQLLLTPYASAETCSASAG